MEANTPAPSGHNRQSQAHLRPGPSVQHQNCTPEMLGPKDLVVRMLAEVFQVGQAQDGQIRWCQVSSSLVPVSLYSRTTSRWLSYLLAASANSSSSVTAATAAASHSNIRGMSPDSRTFLLLLLQQLNRHRQQVGAPHVGQPGASCAHLAEQQSQGGAIVFQVVAHDFIDGQCKKLINLKLLQPGTKLGQASDYFVYWKADQDHYGLEASTSNVSSGQAQFAISGSHVSLITPGQVAPIDSQIWGLNFASINDAKLFYDICTLNLVELDFNSDYLKQLVLNDRGLSSSVCPNCVPHPESCGVSHENEQRIIRDFLNYKESRSNTQRQQQPHQEQHWCHHRTLVNQLDADQSHQQICPTCNHIVQTSSGKHVYYHQQQQQPDQPRCHTHFRDNSLAPGQSMTRPTVVRTRSRSSTRHPDSNTQATETISGTSKSGTLKRMRSYSTPASPDHLDGVQNQESTTDCEVYHHPRCMSHINKQREQLKAKQVISTSGNSERPQKPIRGVLREANAATLLQGQERGETYVKDLDYAPQSSKILHQTTLKYDGQPWHMDNQMASFSTNFPEASNRRRHGHHYCPRQEQENHAGIYQWQGDAVDKQLIFHQQQHQQKDFRHSEFVGNQLSQGRSTGNEVSTDEHFNSLSYRNARLARAQYANSKNMKEFFSLDAGGLQLAPNKAVKDKFLRQVRATSESNKSRHSVVKHDPIGTGHSETNLPDHQRNHPQRNSAISSGAQHQIFKQNDRTYKGIVPINNCEPHGGGGSGSKNEQENCARNVTAKDLQLDSTVRKRCAMFRLTSDEMISERTEPRASLMSNLENMVDEGRVNEWSGAEKMGRQSRAVSLGPERDEKDLRGRSARSDTGRRRSLERSMCVDLDSSLPLHSFKKTCPLSPPPQSTSLRTLDKEKGLVSNSEGEAATGGSSGQPVAGDLNQSAGSRSAPEASEPRKDFCPKPASGLASGTPGKQSLYGIEVKPLLGPANNNRSSRSSRACGQEEPCESLVEMVDLSSAPYFDGTLRSRPRTNHYHAACGPHSSVGPRMLSFKSAPDVRRLCDRDLSYDYEDGHQFVDGNLDHSAGPARATPGARSWLEHEGGGEGGGGVRAFRNEHAFLEHQDAIGARQVSASGLPKAAPGSYAVPLCFGDERAGDHHHAANYGRQIHSCPSSLKRRRRQRDFLPSHHEWQRDPMVAACPYSTELNDCNCHLRTQQATEPRSKRQQKQNQGTYIEQDFSTATQTTPLFRNTGELMANEGYHGEMKFESAPFCLGRSEFAQCAASDAGRANFLACTDKSCVHRRQKQQHQCSHRIASMNHNRVPQVSSAQQQARPCDCTADRMLPSGGAKIEQTSLAHPSSSAGPQAGPAVGHQNRPCSSLSSKSPLRYGLYDSDCDEADETVNVSLACDENMPDDTRRSQLRWTDGTICYGGAIPSLAGGSNFEGTHGLNVEDDAMLLPPMCTTSDANLAHLSSHRGQARQTLLKPVQGYDQTMSRGLLSIRKRAKSQPAEVESEQAATFHLNKSIENVQKLIKEVQSELNALRRRPLGLIQFSGTVQSLSSPTEAGGLNPKQQQQQRQATTSAWQSIEAHAGGQAAAAASAVPPAEHSVPATRIPLGRDVSGSKMSNEERSSAPGGGTLDNEPSVHLRASSGLEQRQQAASARNDNTAAVPDSTGGLATNRAGQFKCVGAIRKAGFLSVKRWILKRRHCIELARKQGWKRYWVCLRGTALLFHSVIDKKVTPQEQENTSGASHNIEQYNRLTDLMSWIHYNCASQAQIFSQLVQTAREAMSSDQLSQCYIEKDPRHLIIIDGAIAQPVPEHPRRDHVFCLSTAFGDAYLFQSSCRLETDNWIQAIHNACAASIVRHLTRDEAVKLFEGRIRQLELESEKKLFLRHRLESRLTSMSSMGLVDSPFPGPSSTQRANGNPREAGHQSGSRAQQEDVQAKKTTMRTLLTRLNQQMLALDHYIEQVCCEIYQLRSYMSSCGAHQSPVRQKDVQQKRGQMSGSSDEGLEGGQQGSGCNWLAIDLPHPRSLLMHISRPTKLFLIKLGIFTVSSFHAYIRARQGGADSVLQTRIQVSESQTNDRQQPSSSLVELRIRSNSFSLASPLLGSQGGREQALESDTEQLIDMANLRSVSLRVSKKLYASIRKSYTADTDAENEVNPDLATGLAIEGSSSDDRYSVQDAGDYISVNLKIHSNSTAPGIIKQVLSIIGRRSSANCSDTGTRSELNFLDYYVRLRVSQKVCDRLSRIDETLEEGGRQEGGRSKDYYLVKRRETLSDWPNFEYMELHEKIIFKLELTRRRADEGKSALPFGISIGAELFVDQTYAQPQQNQLNVYCSYIEWASVAYQAGLEEEDEFLAINGALVMDLDMMFIECIIIDESKLSLVVRASREKGPKNSVPLDAVFWRRTGRDSANAPDGAYEGGPPGDSHQLIAGASDQCQVSDAGNTQSGALSTHRVVTCLKECGSQVVSDEYISSLVCPLPPRKANAFLHSDTTLIRRKSETTLKELQEQASDENGHGQHLAASNTINSLAPTDDQVSRNERVHDFSRDDKMDERLHSLDPGCEKMGAKLAEQLLKKTERLTQLVTKYETSAVNSVKKTTESSLKIDDKSNRLVNSNRARSQIIRNFPIERLRKSILELLETEQAYVEYLETSHDRYINPLLRVDCLKIEDMRRLSKVTSELVIFHKAFLHRLTNSILAHCKPAPNANQEAGKSADINKNDRISRLLDSYNSIEDFETLLKTLAHTFLSEFEKFKIYAIYCVAYSGLQKVIHPKQTHPCNNRFGSSTIASIPNSLDTFVLSNAQGGTTSLVNGSALSNSGGLLQQRDFFKPFGSFLTHNESSVNQLNQLNQLKQLSDFLNHLHSNSVSASSSFTRSSSNSDNNAERPATPAKKSSLAKISVTSSAALAHLTFQRQNRSIPLQDFESFLIRPVQRIVKYPMLLSSILALLRPRSSSPESSEQSSQEVRSASCDSLICPLQKSLQAAVRKMESITSHVNDAQRVQDEYSAIFYHIGRQFLNQRSDFALSTSSSGTQFAICPSNPYQPPVKLNIERLLHFGPVEWLNITDFAPTFKKEAEMSHVLFVFDSCVVFICKEQVRSLKKKSIMPNNHGSPEMGSPNARMTNTGATSAMGSNSGSASSGSKTFPKYGFHKEIVEVIKYQSIIPVSELQVRSSPSKGHKTPNSSSANDKELYRWEMFRLNVNPNLLNKVKKKQQNIAGRIYKLASPSNEIRNGFIRKIRYIIRESVRHMSIPVTRSPSNSKSLTPKKLSSPSYGDTNTNSSSS